MAIEWGAILASAAGNAGGLKDIINPAAEIAGTAYQNINTKQLIREQRNYEARMANTAHVREMEDLARAGVNPILGVMRGSSGAPSPSGGAIPQMQNPFAHLSSSLAAGASRLALKAQAELLEAEKSKTVSQEENLREDSSLKDAQTSLTSAQEVKTLAEANLPPAQKEALLADAALKHAQANESSARTSNLQLEQENMAVDHLLKLKGLNRAEAESNFWNSPYGRASPYVDKSIENVSDLLGTLTGVKLFQRFLTGKKGGK